MKTMIISALAGSLLTMAPIVFSQPVFGAELKRPYLNDNDLVVHEWGTFTALQGSNGQVMDGMQHEEEHLPSFVHSRDPLHELVRAPIPTPLNPPPPAPIPFPRPRCPGFCKGFEPGAIFNSAISDAVHTPVTQKMETPVLYFYSKKPVSGVSVTVDFPKGIISQYYPAPASFSPQLNQVSGLANGQVRFDFSILPEGQQAAIPEVSADSVYAPSREVASNYVQSAALENEKLIFYRGLGDFSTSISITSDETGINIHNLMNTKSPGGILFYTDGQPFAQAGFMDVAELAPSEVRHITYDEIDGLQHEPSVYPILSASQALVQKLEASGLFHDEAVAMANTWKTSYFRKPGLRFLHVLPRAETDALLPLKMSPAPTELNRVLVGRIEIFTRRDEQQLISQIAEQGENLPLVQLGRLAEAKLRRVQQLVPVGFQTDIQKLIERAALAE